ncbi:hypothetical protein BR93DRAFT_935120 [Coniochaeta sp. PMI_546]|nr:hypothetical protein BR93DRAFT_935120 [Coniochaeta sp. PMI_546]
MSIPPTGARCPASLVLLGRDPGHDSYHWEGPYPGAVWETAPRKLFGWLKAYTDDETEPKDRRQPKDKESEHYLIDPNTEEFHLADRGWALVVSKADGKVILRIRREFVFAFKPNPIGTLVTLSNVTSPYAFVGAITRGA